MKLESLKLPIPLLIFDQDGNFPRNNYAVGILIVNVDIEIENEEYLGKCSSRWRNTIEKISKRRLYKYCFSLQDKRKEINTCKKELKDNGNYFITEV